MKLLHARCLVAALLMVSSLPVLALKSDRDQAIDIKADSAERDEKLGITLYHGNVVIRQGTVLIEAETVTIKTRVSSQNGKEELEEIVTVGKPSHLQQQMESGEWVDARSTTIRYEVNSDSVTLVEDAVLKQGEQVIAGNSITYDIGAQKVKARSSDATVSATDNTGTADEPSGRVTVTIPPRSVVKKPAP